MVPFPKTFPQKRMEVFKVYEKTDYMFRFIRKENTAKFYSRFSRRNGHDTSMYFSWDICIRVAHDTVERLLSEDDIDGNGVSPEIRIFQTWLWSNVARLNRSQTFFLSEFMVIYAWISFPIEIFGKGFAIYLFLPGPEFSVYLNSVQ